jgi:uncharacterized coiled-coil protein SlyX
MMEPGCDPAERPDSPSPATAAGWGTWWLIAFASLLAVLFGVSLYRTWELGRRLAEQEQRLQQLESNDALGRTAILEQQLRVTVEQLRDLEERLDDWSRLEEEREAARQRETLAPPSPPPASTTPLPEPQPPPLPPLEAPRQP